MRDGRNDESDGTVPTWSGQASFPGQMHEASAPIDPEAQSQWVVRGEVHDMMCASSEGQNATIQFIQALLHPPKLARTRVGSDGATARIKIFKALAGDRSAEMEVRVAKLLVQEGETVTMLAEDPDDKTPDLSTSNGFAEVKFTEGSSQVRLDELILKGLSQIGDNGRLILVREENDEISASVCESSLESHFESWFGKDYETTVTARHRLVHVDELPPLWTPPPKP